MLLSVLLADNIMFKYILGLQKPNFTKFPKSVSTITVKDNTEEFIGKYEVEGTPFPTITWYKMNGDTPVFLSKCSSNVDEHCQYPEDIYLDIGRQYFQYYSLSDFPKRNGTYKCVATNFLGTVTKTFELNLLGKCRYLYPYQNDNMQYDTVSSRL